MQLPELFRSYLLRKNISKVSAKNYVADVNKFLTWFSTNFKRSFQIDDFSSDLVALYIKLKGGVITSGDTQNGLSDLEVVNSTASTRSFERYTSSLRRFAKFLYEEGLTESNPFDSLTTSPEQVSEKTDPWHLKDFKNHLYEENVSAITIKNYMVDIRAFTTWLEETGRGSEIESGTISLDQVEEYKDRLVLTLLLSPSTVNRKLSSIRKYLNYAVKYGFLHDLNTQQIESVSDNVEADTHGLNLDDLRAQEAEAEDKSKLPPVRLASALLTPYWALEDAAANKIASNIRQKQLEDKIKASSHAQPASSIPNLSREFYAPASISTKNLTPKQKLLHNLKYARPGWYRKYHSFKFTTYLHTGVLVVVACAVGIMLNNQLFGANNQSALAQYINPNKVFSFKGILTDPTGNPIKDPTEVRFVLYNDAQATGAAHMLWQEVNTVKPNERGEFVQQLGDHNPISEDLLGRSSLFIGLSIGQGDELAPRKQITQAGLAASSETLSGMLPITDPEAGTSNVVLALDSTGNLTIGGSSSPTFQATNGLFTLSGVGVSIETALDTNADIRLAPDGYGRISVEKALVNNSDSGLIVPGGVEINDRFGVIATESAVAAFVVNNNTTGGDIFTASSSGVTRFNLGNNGDISLQPNLSIDTLSEGSISIGNRTATNISLGRYGQNISLPNYTAANGILFGSYGTGVLAQATTNITNQCLVSGNNGNPTWADCQNSSWQIKSGTIQPVSPSADILIGGDSTQSAKFAFFNVNRGIPTASVAGNLTIMPRYNDNDGGRLGIGTTTPESQLDIETKQGQATIRIGDEDGICTFNPTSGAPTWNCTSDANLKTNIEDAQNSLDDLARFRIRDYTIKSSGERVTGVIAQEVQQVAPDLVQKDSSGYLIVKTPSIWNLVGAIQELYEKTKAIDSLAALTSSILSSEENLRAYIIEVTQAGFNSNHVISPLASIDQLRTNVVSPLGSDKVKVAGNIQIDGNATVSGTLTAQEATVSGNLTAENLSATNATISGTLYADNIQANSIEGLDSRIASVAASFLASSQAGIPATPAAQIQPDVIQSSSLATNVELIDVESLSASFATFRDGLISLGPATFNQATVLESFSVGTTLSIGPNSIDTLGQDLEIQPLKQGAVSFLAGAVRIEKDGSLKVKNNATFGGNVAVKGKLKTNVISPLGKGDLAVQNSSGSAVLSVSQLGDLKASGSATVSKLNIALVAPAYAISDTEVVATGSAGTATLKKYTKELTINNPNVTSSSLIYITPVGGTSNQVLYLLRQVANESFTVGLDTPTLLDRQFNWIIVN